MVKLPPEIELLIASAIAYLVTQGLKSVSEIIGYDLSGIAAFITASLVGVIVVFANALLGAIPPEAQPSVVAGFGLLVALLGAFGIHRTLKK